MKITILLIFSLQFLFISISKAQLFKVVIDPGHGGQLVKGRNDGSQESHGASHNNATVKKEDGSLVYEKDIALAYAKALKEQLLKYKVFDVTLTRDDDSSPSAMMRAAIAVEKQADVYLSLHFNAGGGKGPRAYVVAEDHQKWEYIHYLNPYVKRDAALARSLVISLEKAFQPYGGQVSPTKVFNDTHSPTNDHGLGKGNLKDGIRTIGYARMDTHLFNAAVVLLEIEFLNTKNYSEFLIGKNKDKVQHAAVAFMARAIYDYKQARVKIIKPVKARR